MEQYSSIISFMKGKTMTRQIIIITLVMIGLNAVIAAETATEQNAAVKEAPGEAVKETALAQEPVLPEKGSTEYWIVRSEAISEFIPLLTQKRTEIKKKRQMLADYLLKIDKADEFAARQMPVTYDAKVYAEILQIGEAFSQMNVEVPKERPSWDALVEIAMKYIVYEGYSPTEVEEGEEAAMYIDICRKKEEYGQKVRQDIRSLMDQTAKIWVYLDSIGELDKFKAHAADIVLSQKAAKAQEKAMYEQTHREEVIARARDKEEREFETAEARAEWRSGRSERVYESRQDQLQYRQSRLDERFVNSRAYYY
jgi:hypothetical protein